jgi:hypothetical protein
MTHTARGLAAALFIALGLFANPAAAQRGPGSARAHRLHRRRQLRRGYAHRAGRALSLVGARRPHFLTWQRRRGRALRGSVPPAALDQFQQ